MRSFIKTFIDFATNQVLKPYRAILVDNKRIMSRCKNALQDVSMRDGPLCECSACRLWKELKPKC